MSYGLRITNPNGELTLSSDAKGLYCVGRASLQSLVQSSGDPETSIGKTTGSSTYRISHAGQILVAVDLPEGYFVSVLGVEQVAAGVWDITVSHGTTADSDQIITTQVALAVWAFGVPVSNTPFSSYGMAIYDAAGNLAWDLSRPNPLFIRGYVLSAATLAAQVFTIPSLSRPVLLGAPSSYQLLDGRLANVHTVFERRSAVKRSGTSLNTSLVGTRKARYLSPEDGDQIDDPAPITSFILEGATLP